MYDVLDVCEYMIQKCVEGNKFMNNLKLQGLLYFIQVEFLIKCHKRCFKNRIEAWDYGAVVPDVYYAYRMYGISLIPYVAKSSARRGIRSEDRDVIDMVLDRYSEFSVLTLVELMWRQVPWVAAYSHLECGNEITADCILESYEEICTKS